MGFRFEIEIDFGIDFLKWGGDGGWGRGFNILTNFKKVVDNCFTICYCIRVIINL
jgi:hypothetical protein